MTDFVAQSIVARASYNTPSSIRAWRFPLPLRQALSSEEAAELNRLLVALPAAVAVAGRLLRESSIHDAIYMAADAEVSKLLARISELMNRKHADDASSRLPRE